MRRSSLTLWYIMMILAIIALTSRLSTERLKRYIFSVILQRWGNQTNFLSVNVFTADSDNIRKR
ncbi:MAG: hypothetical protein KAT54_07285, partial [Candidatus Marinimicrobia bacterium]|nr:hypothetical protein [Candidatus Neomarinimicrobiota bacterium]